MAGPAAPGSARRCRGPGSIRLPVACSCLRGWCRSRALGSLADLTCSDRTQISRDKLECLPAGGRNGDASIHTQPIRCCWRI
ncbi:hypothetical protein ACFPRL_00975 [Pseudoclavibacter helvolus]